MQSGNAGGLFQQAAALIRPGLDDFADAPLIFRSMPSSVSFQKLRKRLLRQVRQAMEDFAMLKGQRRWLVGLSGGKDSYGMLDILLKLQARAPVRFELIDFAQQASAGAASRAGTPQTR